MDKIKSAFDNIKIDSNIKKSIYDKVIEKAEKEPIYRETNIHKVNFKRYKPIITAACFTIILGSLFTYLSMNETTGTQSFAEMRLGLNEPELYSFTFYRPSEDGFEEYQFTDVSTDLGSFFSILVANGFYPDYVSLYSFSSDGKSITVVLDEGFNNYIEIYGDKAILAIEKSVNSLYPYSDVTIEVNSSDNS
ncbi:MAG: hypothetical protein R3Y33_03300 [Clostridia bacterium]